ncbi:ABC transporter permease [Phytomonospora sp. NPDC050363]|uniref:ABC transporter permease n=1 Tax=Phytomonospora sp. NPDC050363 TaxID=3155642 RepID=UPI0033EB8E8A
MLTSPFTLITMAWRGLRSRWTTFAATFVALALGVGLVAAMGQVLAGTFSAPDREPVRYAEAPVVVRSLAELRVEAEHGPRTEPLPGAHPLSPALLDRLAEAGEVTVDRVFEVGLPDGPATGRPWAAARFSGTEPVSGRAPVGAGEVTLATGAGEVGDELTVYTGLGPARYQVVGLAPVGEEATVYFSDAEAARLDPVVRLVVVDAAEETVRGIVGSEGEVFAGDERSLLDPANARDTEALVAANSLVGTAGGIAAFVSIFVVASTFAFAVGQRRREFALLRAAGATPRQVRRTVMTEATLLGLAGSAAGCALGDLGGPELAAWLRELGMAPPWFVVGSSPAPVYLAFAVGVLVSWCGAWAASRRAGGIGPTETLRETHVQPSGLSPLRWVFGLAALAGALAMLVQPLLEGPASLLKRKQYTPLVLLVLIALAVLAPVLVPPVARLVTWPLSRLRGATGMLARESALAASGRTAATAAPVLLTVGLAVCLLGAAATVDNARTEEEAARVTAEYVIGPGLSPHLTEEMATAAAGVPGAEVTATRETVLFDLEEDTALLRRQARAVDPAVFGASLTLPVLAGAPAELDDDSIVVDTEWGRELGERVSIWRADGSPVTLRVVAVLREGAGGNGAYVTAANAPGAELGELLVSTGEGSDSAVVAAGLRAALEPLGAESVSRAEWASAERAEAGGATRLGMRVVLGIALTYTGLFVAGTLVMATRDRRPERRLLRMAGATSRQLLQVLALETVLVLVVGTLLAALAGVLVLGGMSLALLTLTGTGAVVVPWALTGAVVGACGLVALASAVGAALPGLSRP